MLTQLRIASLGVIDDAEVDLGPGFTAVTGETGAGKTMIVTSLGLLLGEKGEGRLVRHGASRALVEGRLAGADDPQLADAVDSVGGALDDGEVLLTRVVTPTRSRALVGGAQVPVGTLSDVVGERITIHGQSDQVRLSTPDRQREVLDAYAGPELATVLAGYRARYTDQRARLAERAALTTQAQERARELAMLDFGLAEIAKAAPSPGEDDALRAEAKRLQAVDDLRAAARSALIAVAGDDDSSDEAPSALGLVAAARRSLDASASDDEAIRTLGERVREAGYLLGDAAAELASYLAGLDADPARLEAIAGRLSVLQGLTRRYADSVDGVLAWAEEAEARASELRGSDDRLQQLNESIATGATRLKGEAERLSGLRRAAASELGALVETELAALAMPRATLSFEVTASEGLGPHGGDKVEILFTANPGSAPAPLSRVASGGELSRVRLALEVVVAGRASTSGRTFVFDEVDAGVGGTVALEIGRRLARLSRSAQVVVVTHLAQVAAFADRQFVVSKADDGQVTTSGVREVSGDERVAELARMMAGLEDTEAARRHAEELLEVGRRR